jgi:DNA-binding MarR family transcriptional regulator
MLNLALGEAIAYLNGEVAPDHPELTPAHLQLFRTGAIEGRRVTELAAAAGMTKQSMHELVVRLESLGYLRREVDPADIRARRITLTERGRTLKAEVAAASDRLHQHWRETLGDELFATLWTALDKLTGQVR